MNWLTLIAGRRAAMLTASLICCSIARSDSAVIPRNDPSVDVAAVQAAVNSGGQVELGAGVFNFGTSGGVTLTQDVVIRGRVDNRGEPTTVIRGGLRNFRILATPIPPSRVPPPQPQIAVTIQDIASEGATSGWIAAQDFRSLAIRNVRVRMGQPGFAVNLQPRLARSGAVAYWDGGELGDITIEDSSIEVPGGNPALPSVGIFVNNLGNLDQYSSIGGHTRPLKPITVGIQNNRINTSTLGVIAHSFAGRAVYAKNDIRMQGTALVPADTGIAVGIFVGNNLGQNSDRADIRTDVLLDNSVHFGETPTDTAGILVTGTTGGVQLRGNDVDLLRGVGLLATTLVTGLSTTSLRIRGRGESAINFDPSVIPGDLLGGLEKQVQDNTLVGLNLNGFTGTAADITLKGATSRNTFVGIGHATVSETEGAGNNIFTGINVRSAPPGTVGSRVSAAVKALLDMAP